MRSITAPLLALAATIGLGACFTGTFLAGQPCSVDADCGPSLACTDGLCGGATGGAGSAETTSDSATSVTPTSSTSSTPSTSATTTIASGTTSSTGTTTSASTTTTPASASDGTESSSTTGAACGIGTCKDLDLLIILDDSTSMGEKSTTLLSVMLSFINDGLPAFEDACSLHIGMLTTNVYEPNPEECRKLGSLIRTDTNGEPCPFAEGHPYATAADVTNPASLACIATVGSKGSNDEKPFDSLLAVFDSQLNAGCNEGFLRPDAFLLVIIVTDEDDGDADDPQGNPGSKQLPIALWHDALTGLAGGTDNFYLAALLGDEDEETTLCPWDPLAGVDGAGASPAPNLRNFIKSFSEDHQHIGSICNTDPEPSDFTSLMHELTDEVRAVCGAD